MSKIGINYLQLLLIVVGFTFIEPLFETLCLFIHNFVFSHIAKLEFGAVSLGSIMSFIFKIPVFTMWDQYKSNLPLSFALGLLLAYGAYFYYRSLLFALLQSLIIILIVTLLIIIKTNGQIYWSQGFILITYILSCIYWIFSVSLTWLLLYLLKIIR